MEFLRLAITVPQKAGKARLEFKGSELPSRKDDLLKLPRVNGNQDDWDWRMVELQPDWNQFLLYSAERNSAGMWFGGTDENPFLVRLDRTPVRTAEMFYESLVPGVIRVMAKALKIQWFRQGDIFAVPASTWEAVTMAAVLNGVNQEGPQAWEQEALFGTRHIATGTGLQTKGGAVFEGVIEAPDHAPLTLKGPHLLAQTAHLHNPKTAD